MGKKTKTPQAPDYTSIANQQALQSKAAWNDQMQANRPNQTNQYGSLTWEQDPETGAWTQNNQLNAPQQDIFNQQQANQQGIANAAGGMLGGLDTSQIDFSGAPAMGQVGGFDQQATDLYRQLGQPDLDRSQAARRASLAARGISDVTSGAGANMEAQLGDQTNRFAMEAAQRGIAQGNTMFGQQNQLHQQGISDIVGERQANLGQLQGMMGLGQQVGVPQYNPFQSVGAYQTPDLMGAAQGQYGAQMDKTNAANADSSRNAQMAGTAVMAAATIF